MKAHIPDTLGPGAFFVLLQVIEQIVKRHDLFLVSDLSNQQEEANPLAMLQKLGMQMGREPREEWQRGTGDDDPLSEDQMPRSDEGRLHAMVFPCIIGFSLIYRWNYIHPSLARHADHVGSFDMSLIYNPAIDEEGLGTRNFCGDLRDAARLMDFVKWLCKFCHCARMKAQCVTAVLDQHLDWSEAKAKNLHDHIVREQEQDDE